MKKIIICLILIFVLAFQIVLISYAEPVATGMEQVVRIGLTYGSIDKDNLYLKSTTGLEVMGTDGLMIPLNSTEIGMRKSGISDIEFYDVSTGEIRVTLPAIEDLIIMPMVEEGKIPTIEYDKRKYRGHIVLRRMTESDITVINVLPLEKYLCGVVPNELMSYAPIESLKAQAVAARNYAMRSSNKHKKYGFDLCATVDCQMYLGYSSEAASTNQAINETTGIMAYYNNKPIEAVYSSTTGGHSENSEDVWNEAVPYLRGRADPYSIGTPYDNWETKLTKQEIMDKMTAKNNDIGDLLSVKVTKSSADGRARELQIVGTKKTMTYKKESVRLVFGLRSTMYSISNDGKSSTVIPPVIKTDEVVQKDIYLKNDTNTVLNTKEEKYVISAEGASKIDLSGKTIKTSNKSLVISSNFDKPNETITQPTITDNADVYTIKGKGYGHGIGMSQYGAMEMGKQGFKYDEILKFYYTGIEVK